MEVTQDMRRSPADEMDESEELNGATYEDVFGEDWDGPDRREIHTVESPYT